MLSVRQCFKAIGETIASRRPLQGSTVFADVAISNSDTKQR